MQYAVSLRKIAQLAAKAEEAGESYYRKIAELASEERVKKICLYFAEQEKEHKETFNKIVEETQKDHGQRNFTIDVVYLLNEGIKKVRDTGFQSPDFDYSKMDINQCLELALHLEQETIAIYEEIRREMDTNYNVILYKIIKEENEHAKSIINVLEQRDPKRQKQERKVQIIEPEKVEVRRRKILPNRQDYIYIFFIFLFLIGIILAMTGPRYISYIIKALDIK